MNKRLIKTLTTLFLIASCSAVVQVSGQANNSAHRVISDSLVLNNIIKVVLDQHPSIQEAQEAIKAADARIALAKTAQLPNVDGNASYTRIGPVPSFSLPDGPTFKLAPANNYNTSIDYHQNIYDFGKTASEVAVENENKELAKLTIDQIKQRLALTVVNAFYTLAYLQEARIIKDQQISTLNEHLAFVNKKKETGSATQYEVLATKVKISTAETQKLDLEAAITVQQGVLNALMGQPESKMIQVKNEVTPMLLATPSDSLLSYAFNHRDEIKISNEKTNIAELRYKSIKTELKPSVNAYASVGGKNGYVPDLNKYTANFSAGVGLRVPIMDAYRNRSNLLLAKSAITSSSLDTEVTKRMITNDVVENDANRMAALKKIDQYALQLSQAQEALGLAETSYQNGTLTNLDLIDATLSVSESKLQLLKSRIDYSVSLYRLKMALGDRLY
ncbi:MAG: TolC family protein [Bacteroidota bacterium]|nr:TolC family protein [Bacteroidota bacterium]